MSNPSIEHPYDMVHVRPLSNGRPRADGQSIEVETIKKEVEAERAPFIEAARKMSTDNVIDAITTRGFECEGDGGPQPRPKRKRADRANRPLVIAMDRKLREVLTDQGDGTWSFHDEWDDHLVAAAVGARPNQVRYHRLECFGPEPEKQAGDPVAARAYQLVLNLYKMLGVELPE